MVSNFKDHFSRQADDYTRYRPTYPPELFTWLATLTTGHSTAWDCGCGNGQAAVSLADHYQQVLATDPSSRQIDNAHPHPGVSYSMASAEQSGLADNSIDLIVVAQALHWFDFSRFYTEVRRVAHPAAVLAAISYGEIQVEGEAGAVITRFYHETIASCWPPERSHVDEGYRNIPFPFTRITPPPFAMTVQWSYEQLLGYLGTWSAVQEFAKQHGHDPRTLLRAELAAAWGDPELPRHISWPLTLLIGRIDG
jgi:ubiquinone/menaquinone biosynthesis C-methylase UbiE